MAKQMRLSLCDISHGSFVGVSSHKANLPCPYDMMFEGNTEGNPMVVPVCASPGVQMSW